MRVPKRRLFGGERGVPIDALGDEKEDEGVTEEDGAVGEEGEREPGVTVVDRC